MELLFHFSDILLLPFNSLLSLCCHEFGSLVPGGVLLSLLFGRLGENGLVCSDLLLNNFECDIHSTRMLIQTCLK